MENPNKRRTPKRPCLEFQGVRLQPEASAGVLLAVVLGAAPAAFMGLDVAWIVVASGLSALLLAPILAVRQVKAVTGATGPSDVMVQAGRIVDVPLELEVVRRAHGVLLSLHERQYPKGAADGTHGHLHSPDRAPRLALSSMGPPERGHRVEIKAPLRLAVRGRYPELHALLSSSFPLGLVTARVTRPLGTSATALPRSWRTQDGAELAAIRSVLRGSATREVMCRARGQGSPATLRPAREGDTARDLNMRASYRRQKWIAVERTQLSSETLEIVLACTAWDEETGAESRRGHAAFESATSLGAAVVLMALGEGLGVTLSQAPNIHSPQAATPLSQGSRGLPHLLALTDASYGCREAATVEALKPHLGGGTRVLIGPIMNVDRAELALPPGFDLCILVDPHGRTRQPDGLAKEVARVPLSAAGAHGDTSL